jgi:hypothetical protein
MSDPYIPLGKVPSIPWLPRRRGHSRPHVSTIWRWVLKGLRARDGALVKLRAMRCGGTLCTSESWVREFFEELTSHDPALLAPTPTAVVRTPTQRQRASERAAEALRQLGI